MASRAARCTSATCGSSPAAA